MNHLDLFGRELRAREVQPERLALFIGYMVDPDLAIDHYLAWLDNLAWQVGERIPVTTHGPDRAGSLLSVLWEEMGYTGNTANYYDPANSFLHLVLERRLGLPITLSLLYMAVGRRLGIELQGMGFPGHFMLRFRDDRDDCLLDPFHGRRLASNDVAAYLAAIFRQPVDLQRPLDDYAVSPRALILRVLNNLRAIYLAHRDFPRAIQVLNYMVLVEPEETTLWRERGLLCFQAGHLLDAESDLRRFFYQRNQLHHFVESRPIAGLLPFISGEAGGRGPELADDTLEVLAVVDHIRQAIARLN